MEQYPFPRGTPKFDARMVVLTVIAVAVLMILYSAYYQIEPGEQGVVLRFGRYARPVFAGPHLKLPWPVEKLLREQVARVRLLQIGYRDAGDQPQPVMQEAEMLTGDKNIVVCPMNVQYTIDSLNAYLFNTRNPGTVVHDAAEAALRQVIGYHKLDDALSERKNEIETQVREKMEELINHTYRIRVQIRQVQLRDVRVPDEVVEAFRDVTSAKEDSARSIEQAESYRNRVSPKAQADSIALVRDAEGYAMARLLQARGDSARFVKVYNEYRTAREVTEIRLYLETMEKVLRARPKYLIDSDGRNFVNVLPMTDAARRALEGGPR
jgi:membrane protease subunit HflK